MSILLSLEKTVDSISLLLIRVQFSYKKVAGSLLAFMIFQNEHLITVIQAVGLDCVLLEKNFICQF